MKSLTRAGWLALLLAGCTTTGTIDIPRLANSVQLAAEIGTNEALRDHQEWRPAFVLARDRLNELATRDLLTVNDLLNITASLPVSELSSDTARLSFEGARLLVAITGWSDVVVVRTEQLRPVALALSNGISAGLGQAPPMPTLMQRTGRHYKAR